MMPLWGHGVVQAVSEDDRRIASERFKPIIVNSIWSAFWLIERTMFGRFKVRFVERLLVVE
jgi:hypothetical protein